MVSKIIIVTVSACVVMSAMHQTSAIPPGGVTNPAIPAWIANAPWMPKWVTCDPAQPLGATCEDCNTKLICTAAGGLLKGCNDPKLPHCNAGQCSATPSAQCSPANELSAATAPAAEAAVI